MSANSRATSARPSAASRRPSSAFSSALSLAHASGWRHALTSSPSSHASMKRLTRLFFRFGAMAVSKNALSLLYKKKFSSWQAYFP